MSRASCECIRLGEPSSPGGRLDRTAIAEPTTNRMLLRLVTAATIGSLLFSTRTDAQVLPPLKKAAQVEIIEEPALELAHDDLAIIRWTMSNPGGSDDHFGVVYSLRRATVADNLITPHQARNGGDQNRA
jgi:hypothetical protein